MPIYMYPAVAAPERNISNFAQYGKAETGFGTRQGSVVVPGEVIFSSSASLITGHGTYREAEDEAEATATKIPKMDGRLTEASASLAAGGGSLADVAPSDPIRTSLTGRVRIVNKLVYVEPPKAKYAGNVGDTVIGRIIEVEQRRWRVDVNSYLLGNLALANVKLPGGELRRKSEDDERAMRTFMKEGDLIVAEVHEVYKDGSLQLHMPGTRTGKLGGGCLLRIPPSLVKRQKLHRHRLSVPSQAGGGGGGGQVAAARPGGGTSGATTSVGLILGCNGYVWIGASRGMDIGLGLSAPSGAPPTGYHHEGGGDGGSALLAERIAICRVRNCLLALTANSQPVWETNVLAACEASCLLANQEEEEEENDEMADFDDGEDGAQGRGSNRISRLLQPDVARRLVSLVEARLGKT